MRPRKAKPLPQGSYGQRSPRRVTKSPSNGGGRRVAANRPHRPCSVAPTIMVTVLPACLGRQGRHVVTSRPHAVSMTEPSQVRRLSSEIVPLCSQFERGPCFMICPQAKCQSSSAFYARQLYTRCNAPILCKRHGNQQSKCGEDIQIEDAIRCPKCGVLSTPQGVELLICRKAPHRTKHCDPDMPSCRD
ncbi:hypothetical protein PCANC_12131 [Puccinia coronata f. sp. avenae]|uniref:Uncharacterized protein n=1 Tax=Puccinia coronata f. sp. avenae TaxID=200324 RepID=A0A2N5VGF2_9BASI|nr:hypothetical protein PCANC_12131 [Puccinia coronata f. sp. avenae]